MREMTPGAASIIMGGGAGILGGMAAGDVAAPLTGGLFASARGKNFFALLLPTGGENYIHWQKKGQAGVSFFGCWRGRRRWAWRMAGGFGW